MARKDDLTMELPGVVKRVGRPPTGKARDGAARQRAYRSRLASEGRQLVTVDLSGDVAEALHAYVDRQNADVAEDRITLGQAVERVLRDRLMRKR